MEINRHETLAGAVLQVLQNALIPRVIRDDQKKVLVGLKNLPLFFHGEDPPVIGQGMNQDGGVFAGLDNLVQVADGPVLHSPG